MKVDDKPVQVTLCDTAGQDFLDPLRRLCYPDSDVFLLCFSVIKPDTFVAVREKWMPIFRKSQTPIVLVGTQADLRHDSAVVSQLLVSKEIVLYIHENKFKIPFVSMMCQAILYSGLCILRSLRHFVLLFFKYANQQL